jgi:NAD(P)-dependent dehydrogenase (short-subunit alcohol dehydrogenase family)
METFEGKAVLVTGGARGIGRAIARAFAARGARVAITYLTRGEEAQATLAALPGGGHLAVRADLTDPAQAERAVGEATRALGRLDVVVNNAGIWEAHPIDSASSEEWLRAWQRTLAVNLVAPANVCYHAARWMKEHGGGRIVNVSSRGAFRGEPEAPGYAASKAGLNAMSQSLAQRLAPHGITVAVVAPGFVDTERVAPRLAGESGAAIRAQSPLGRVATPEEVADAVVYLASPGSEFATGAILDLNGASYLRT